MGGQVELHIKYKKLNLHGYNSLIFPFLIFSIFGRDILQKYRFFVNPHFKELKVLKYHIIRFFTVLFLISLIIVLTLPTSSALSNSQDVAGQDISDMRALEEEFENGSIDLDHYILYKALGTFKSEKISKKSFSLSSISDSSSLNLRKCGTPVLLEIKGYWDQLSPETKQQLEWITLRPTEPGGDYPSFEQHKLPQLYFTEHFVIHYTKGDDGGSALDAPDLSDSNNNGVPDYIEDVGRYFEDAYEFSISRGFEPPVDDSPKRNDDFNSNPDSRYDIFVYNLGSGFYGVTYAEQYPNTPSYSFISVNSDYNWALDNDDPEGYIKGALKITAAHEFHHAIQFSYDVNEEAWWYEATSTYFEDEIYPQVNDNYNFIGKYFNSGNYQYFEHIDQYSLNEFNGWHEYGSFIFVKKLSEDMGDDIVRKIWEECRNNNGISAINKVLINAGSNFYLEFINFTRANYFLEEYEDGNDYRNVLNGNWNPNYENTFNGAYIEYEYDYKTTGNQIPFKITSQMLNRDSWMAPWSADYVRLKLNPSENYRVFFNGLDNSTSYIVGLAYVDEENSKTIEKIFKIDEKKDGFSDISGKEEAVLIIMNAGSYSTKDPSWELTITRKTAVTSESGIANIIDEFGHEYVEIGVEELKNYDKIKMYDTIFIDPAFDKATVNSSSSINEFVEKGGVLFAPYNTSELIKSSFPENVQFYQNIENKGANVEAEITDFGFSTYTGLQNINLSYNESSGFIESLKGRYRVYIMGDVYFSGENQNNSRSGVADLLNVPIVASFEYGKGIVVYSSLSETGNNEHEYNITKYLTLITLTEKLAMANEEMLRNEGYLFFKDIRGIIDGGNKVEYSYTTKDKFKVVLNWEILESELGLTLFVNDEFFDEIISKGPPTSILVENASSKYTYRVSGSQEPLPSTEYVLTIGENPFQASLLSPVHLLILFISLSAVCALRFKKIDD